MIPSPYLTQWRTVAPWPIPAQVEQDLILSRLIIEIANHQLLSGELALRGGTCLHKLHMAAPYRYSEDLDYVRTGKEPLLGRLLTALREIADQVGLREHRRRFPNEQSIPSDHSSYCLSRAAVGDRLREPSPPPLALVAEITAGHRGRTCSARRSRARRTPWSRPAPAQVAW